MVDNGDDVDDDGYDDDDIGFNVDDDGTDDDSWFWME